MDVLKNILGSEIDVHAKDSLGNSALHKVVESRYCTKDAVQMLLQMGAPVNAVNCNDETPLHLAVRNCTPDIIKCLLENGANVHATTKNGETPLHFIYRLEL